MRLLVKRMVGPKFARAGRSVEALRRLDAFAVENQKIPPGTGIEAVSMAGIAAERVRAAGVGGQRAVLFLHGGAFVMGSPATHRELAARVSAATDATVFVPAYRLAPEHPFPAAVHDTIAAYRWLRDEGYTAARIAFGGDSAGGGLALQALIALRDEGETPPAAAFCFSPPTDWVRFDGESYETRARVDPMNTLELCRFTAGLYVGDAPPDTPLLSPARHDLSGLPPLCIHVGDDEILLSDAVRFADRAAADGVEVVFRIWPGMWHVFQHSARLVPEARRSLEEVGRFVKRHVGRDS